jgi:hypothetical protein
MKTSSPTGSGDTFVRFLFWKLFANVPELQKMKFFREETASCRENSLVTASLLP